MLSIIAVSLLIICLFTSCSRTEPNSSKPKPTLSGFRQSITTEARFKAYPKTTSNLTPFQQGVSTYSNETISTATTTTTTINNSVVTQTEKGVQ